MKAKDDISDQGGVVWHTQGSGKSIVHVMACHPAMYNFENPPIVIVTIVELDESTNPCHIHGVWFSCSSSCTFDKTSAAAPESPSGRTTMTTIQKFGTPLNHIHTKEKVIALVDETHRTQYRFNAEAMRSAMPNAVFFAFSGTPIDKKDKSTYRVFGPLLDKYSFEESKEDGATLPIYYEEREPSVFLEGEDTIDELFERMFPNLDARNRNRNSNTLLKKR